MSFLRHLLPACTFLYLKYLPAFPFLSFRCWLPTEHYTIFAFIGPMVAIIVVSFHTLSVCKPTTPATNNLADNCLHIRLAFHTFTYIAPLHKCMQQCNIRSSSHVAYTLCTCVHKYIIIKSLHVLCNYVLSLRAGKCCIADYQFGVSSQVAVGKDN